jgi:hypothetical protein
MEKQIQKLIDIIKADYASWVKLTDDSLHWVTWSDDSIKQKMIDSFNSGLGYKKGKKYIKIMQKNGGTPVATVWGFIVNVDDDPKFKKGDILYPASCAWPTRNRARGNIIDGNFKGVTWTGPAYLI